jgi:hypothetical protein
LTENASLPLSITFLQLFPQLINIKWGAYTQARGMFPGKLRIKTFLISRCVKEIKKHSTSAEFSKRPLKKGLGNINCTFLEEFSTPSSSKIPAVYTHSKANEALSKIPH